MPRLIAGVILSMTRVQLAVASMDSAGCALPTWKLVTKAVVPRGLDPLLVMEKLLSAVGAVDTIVIHQPEAPAVLLRRYAHDTVMLVQPPHPKSRALWTPLMPKDWAPLLSAHWRVVDLVYAHVLREYQSSILRDRTHGDANSVEEFFEQFKYRPQAPATQ